MRVSPHNNNGYTTHAWEMSKESEGYSLGDVKLVQVSINGRYRECGILAVEDKRLDLICKLIYSHNLVKWLPSTESKCQEQQHYFLFLLLRYTCNMCCLFSSAFFGEGCREKSCHSKSVSVATPFHTVRGRATLAPSCLSLNRIGGSTFTLCLPLPPPKSLLFAMGVGQQQQRTVESSLVVYPTEVPC